jgi:hypothetical protein
MLEKVVRKIIQSLGHKVQVQMGGKNARIIETRALVLPFNLKFLKLIAKNYTTLKIRGKNNHLYIGLPEINTGMLSQNSLIIYKNQDFIAKNPKVVCRKNIPLFVCAKLIRASATSWFLAGSDCVLTRRIANEKARAASSAGQPGISVDGAVH